MQSCVNIWAAFVLPGKSHLFIFSMLFHKSSKGLFGNMKWVQMNVLNR